MDRNDKVFTLIRLELNLFRSLRHPIKLRDLKGESSHPGAIFLYLHSYLRKIIHKIVIPHT